MSKFAGASEKTIKKWIARGDGQGIGLNFSPFFRVQDVPSKGKSHKVLGLKIPRIHHLLSNLEYWHYILCEYDLAVAEIREQFALLPWESTQRIAKIYGIKHPVYPKHQVPTVMTSDLVLTLNYAEKTTEVISVKYYTDVDPDIKKNKRTLEKLLIEKVFWQRRGIKWKLSTEQDISITRAMNLDTLRTSMVAYELDWLPKYMEAFVEQFHTHWTDYRTLNEILKKAGNTIHLDLEKSFFLFGRAVWQHALPIDLDSELIGHNFPVKLAQMKMGEEQND